MNPKLIVADEAVSALDVSVQAQILNLLRELQARYGLAFLFISHDVSVVRYMSDRIAVMYVGKIVESASRDVVLNEPAHPYTEALLSAIPQAGSGYRGQRIILGGEPPDPSNVPPGCPFHPRCRYAQEICIEQEPKWRAVGPNHYVTCHLTDSLTLEGV
jgi:oligopeptide/dipeptide ABC transporter ATP-binding protein